MQMWDLPSRRRDWTTPINFGVVVLV